MKKFAKMSLVAAVAVAGLTGTASAKDLTEAIKGVDISGAVRYRIEDAKTKTTGTEAEDQDVNIDIKIKVPVNDMVTFVANSNYDDDTQEGGATASDSSGTLDQYYFQYANGPVTALLGTQDIPGRLTDSEEGSGLVALYNAGAFTVGAAAMYNAGTVVTSEALLSVIAMGTVGPVSLLAQYVDVDNTLDTIHGKADVKVGPAMVGVEYAETDYNANSNKNNTFKAYVSGKVDIVSAQVSYASTGKDGAGSIDMAAETPAEFLLWQLGSFNKSDLDVYAIDASVAVTDKVSVRVAFADGEYGTTNTDIQETLGQVSYKMSSNLNTYLRLSELEDGTSEKTRGRVEVRYAF